MRPFLLVLAVAACAPAVATRSSPMAAEIMLGAYDFTVRDGAILMTGTLEVRGDSATIRSPDTHCFPDPMVQATDERLAFKCNIPAGIEPMSISFDRRDPAARAYWSGKITRTVNRSVCISYAIDERGRQYCTGTRIESEEVTGPIGGRIIVKTKG